MRQSKSPDGLTAAPAGSVQECGLLVVLRPRGQEGSPGQEGSAIAQMLPVSCAGEHLHADRMACGDPISKEVVDPIAHRTAGIA